MKKVLFLVMLMLLTSCNKTIIPSNIDEFNNEVNKFTEVMVISRSEEFFENSSKEDHYYLTDSTSDCCEKNKFNVGLAILKNNTFLWHPDVANYCKALIITEGEIKDLKQIGGEWLKNVGGDKYILYYECRPKSNYD